jgi:outer membrane protein assembly factor BamB
MNLATFQSGHLREVCRQAECPPWFLSVALLICSSTLPGAETTSDWPQFLGPTRDGVYHGPALAATWPETGLTVAWKREVGAGFSGPVVQGDRLILFHRLGDRATVDCLEPTSGRSLWRADYPTDYRDDFGFDAGPRATPAIADGQVITFGAEGRLSSWDLATGQPRWSVDTAKEFGAGKGWFGRACSPLIEDGLVIVGLGGNDGAGIVAFDAATGVVRWKATQDEASYASPIIASLRGRKTILALTREALVGLEPGDGQPLFRYPWRPRANASVSAATPLVIDDYVFISASYGAGATLLRPTPAGMEPVWSNDESLSSHYATSVHHQGFLYGWHGRQEQGCALRCVELQTGRVRWTESGLKAGTVTRAGDELLVLTEQGELLRVLASPDRFKAVSRAQLLPGGVRAHPAVAQGWCYARSPKLLVGLDLGAGR